MTEVADVLTLWDESLQLIRDRGLEQRDEPFKLASGQWSKDYIDGKYAIDTGPRLRMVSTAIFEVAQREGIYFTHVGGLTMGADALVTGIAMVAKCGWFFVRKSPKPRGRRQWIEGARLAEGDTVLLVDDVVTTGGSIVKAYRRVVRTGATVTGVIPMVDRGEVARQTFAKLGVPYAALVTYKDLEIDSIGPN